MKATNLLKRGRIMFIYDLIDFLKNYSQDAIIVAILVAITSAIIDRFLTTKQKLYIKIFTPFILGIMFYFLYDVVVNHVVNFTYNIAYAGILCGSLSSGIYAFCFRLLNGKSTKIDKTTLMIEGLIKDFVNKEFITQSALLIKKEFESTDTKDNVINKIKEIITKTRINEIDDKTINILASVIYENVKNLNRF